MTDVINSSVRFTGDVRFTGTGSVPDASVSENSLTANAAIPRSKLAQDTMVIYPVNLTDLRVWNAFHTNLPKPSADDDLGLYGTFATDSPTIRTYDVKALGAVTMYARFIVRIPIEYDDAQTVNLRFRAGMLVTVSDGTATLDVECYKSNKEAGISADLCTTTVVTINAMTFANKDFVITATDLVSGDELDVRITIAVNDASTGTQVTACIGSIQLLCDVRG